MKKLYTFFLAIILIVSKSFSVEYSVFTAAEGSKFLEQNYNLNGWELFQANTSWYPGDTTIVFDFVNGKSSYWLYTYRVATNNNDNKIWTFLLTKINNQFSPLDFGVEDDDFIADYGRLPQKWIDTDMLPMAVQANSTLGQYLMAHFDKVVEFYVMLTPKHVTEENYPNAMWWLSLEVENINEPAYCIFDALTLEKVECFVPDVNSINETNRNYLICYPNPARDYIEIKEYPRGADIKLFNSNGECVISIGTIADLPHYRINTSNLPNGVYYIKSGHTVKPIIIQR